jgi:hypothetical protein
MRWVAESFLRLESYSAGLAKVKSIDDMLEWASFVGFSIRVFTTFFGFFATITLMSFVVFFYLLVPIF